MSLPFRTKGLHAVFGGSPPGWGRISAFNHSSIAWQVCWAAREEKEAVACVARRATFGVLLRALLSRSLLARVHAGPNHRACAACRGRAGVQQRVAVCRVLCRSRCNVVQCGVDVVCVVPVVHGR